MVNMYNACTDWAINFKIKQKFYHFSIKKLVTILLSIMGKLSVSLA